jgi:hypothetical protein
MRERQKRGEGQSSRKRDERGGERGEKRRREGREEITGVERGK